MKNVKNIALLTSLATDIIKGRSSGDPTHGGKLIPTHIVNKAGHHQLVYKSPEELGLAHDHNHQEPLKPGHRVSHPKHGVGTITKNNGHDGKGGHAITVHYDSGKKAPAYVHNVDHLDPTDPDATPTPAEKSTTTTKVAGPKADKKGKLIEPEGDDDVDDFDEDMLSPKERMEEWEQMVFRLTKQGSGVNAALAYGKGGVGKTYRLDKVLKDVAGLKENDDYITVTGGITNAALYETLYKANGKLVVFDDCDDVWSDSDSVNILKGACDTSKKRIITRAKSQGLVESPYPDRFEFTGKVAFISNLNLDIVSEKSKDVEALLTRADSINLRMTNNQTVDLIESDIISHPKFLFKKGNGNAAKTTAESKAEVMAFVKDNKSKMAELSVRTLNKVNSIREFYTGKGEDWKPVAESMLVKGKQDSLDVNERFDSYGDFVEMLANGDIKSVIAYGRGGIGKTFTAVDRLESLGYEDAMGEDGEPGEEGADAKNYVHYQGGKFTPKGLYEVLYKNNGKLIIIDDADTALENKQCQNILKGALDSSGTGKVNWMTSDSAKKKVKLPKKKKDESQEEYQDRLKDEGLADDDGNIIDPNVPSSFEFNGRVLFISNLPEERIAQPLQSRALTINTQMTREEAIQRFRHVAKSKRSKGDKASHNVHEATHDDVDHVIDYFDSMKDQIPDRYFNNRTIDKLLADKKTNEALGRDWKRVAKTKLLKAISSDQLAGINVNIVKGFNELLKTDQDEQKHIKTTTIKGNNMDNKIVKAMDTLIKGGEGSKGGQIIGHTKSGKAIYAHNNPAKQKTPFKGWTGADHKDAADAHDKEYNKYSKHLTAKRKELSGDDYHAISKVKDHHDKVGSSHRNLSNGYDAKVTHRQGKGD